MKDTPAGTVPPAAENGDQESLPPPPHDAVGAYVLDALPAEERLAFEGHLAGCADCRRAVAELAPVVSLLPRLLELDPLPELAGEPATAIPAPSDGLRDRILAAARAEMPETADTAPPPAAPLAPDLGEEGADDAPIAAAAPTPLPPRAAPPTRPRGRIRPGVTTGPAPAAVPVPPRELVRRVPPAWLAAAVLAVVATGAIVWALTLQGRLDDREDEIARKDELIQAQTQQLDDIRRRANATAYALAPTAQGPEGATGKALYSLPDRFGVLYVRGLPALPADRDYQIWFLDEGQPRPGGTFDVDAQGQGVVTFETDVQTLDGLALTAEPTGGSEQPTSDVLLAGTVGGAAG